jgi:uncharacterized protein YdiU (UPF0061 family)
MDARYLPSRAHEALGEALFDEATPARFPRHVLRFRNDRWAERFGLGGLDDEAWERHFARFEPLPGSFDRPLALRYHGHQFGVYNPALGDGRGFLFAQLVEPGSGRLFDLGTKGSGQTRWSRGGDGRLTLKGGVRELLATEMLEALGVPTSKTWSLFETGEALQRGDEPSPTRSSVLVRLGHSHIRFGTFQRLAFGGDRAAMVRLLDHVLEHHYPELSQATDPPLAFMRSITEKMATLAAAFDVAGFVHGVLNTDNMNVNGESFDYGPYRFLPRRDPSFVAAYFDHGGLYAFGRQAETLKWNLGRLADALRLVAPSSALWSAIEGFDVTLESELSRRFVARLGVASEGHEQDALLRERAVAFLEATDVSMDAFFFDWHGGPLSEDRALRGPRAPRYRGPLFDALRDALEVRSPACGASIRAPMFERDHPVTLEISVIEHAWGFVDRVDDWTEVFHLVERIRELGAACARMRP